MSPVQGKGGEHLRGPMYPGNIALRKYCFLGSWDLRNAVGGRGAITSEETHVSWKSWSEEEMSFRIMGSEGCCSRKVRDNI